MTTPLIEVLQSEKKKSQGYYFQFLYKCIMMWSGQSGDTSACTMSQLYTDRITMVAVIDYLMIILEHFRSNDL